MFVEITAPVGALGLLRVDALPERTSIEFERIASALGCDPPSLVVSGDQVETAVAAFREGPFVEDVTSVGETENGVVYRLTWDDTPSELIECIRGTDGTILSAIAVDDAWTFELRFPDQRAVSRFYARYDDPEYPITIHRTSPQGTSRRAPKDDLTPEQREALYRAKQAGYFEVPRQTTTAELARELNISDTATSQRLRRALSNVLQDSAYTSRDVVSSERGGD